MKIFRKYLVIGIIFLFVGASVVPSVISEEKQKLGDVLIVNKGDDCDWIVDDEGDGDFTDLQEAIDTADEGDTICVYSGNFSDDILIEKQLYIYGFDEEYPPNGNDTGNPSIGGTVTITYTSGVVFANFYVGNVPDFGMYIIEAEYNTIDNCYSFICSLSEADHNTVKNSEFYSGWSAAVGIKLSYSSYNTILNNTCGANTIVAPNVGMALYYSNDNEVKNNTCEGFDAQPQVDDIAMQLISSDDNDIINNICWNSDIGVSVDSTSNENVFYLNHFEDNKDYNAYDGSTTNHWNSKEEIWYPPGETDPKYYDYAGNWWDDYRGCDSGNGRGTTPYDDIYPKHLGNKDNYPIGNFSENDTIPPEVHITFPEEGYIYLLKGYLKIPLLNPIDILANLNALICQGGFYKITAIITDEGSGVDPDTVYAYIDKKPDRKWPLEPFGLNKYEGLLETRGFFLFANLVVEARDRCGNPGTDSKLLLIYFNYFI